MIIDDTYYPAALPIGQYHSRTILMSKVSRTERVIAEHQLFSRLRHRSYTLLSEKKIVVLMKLV